MTSPRTRDRLRALERQARADPAVTVWHQDMAGVDRYTSSKHKGLILTRAQLEARPEPANGMRILVQYVGATAQLAGDRLSGAS